MQRRMFTFMRERIVLSSFLGLSSFFLAAFSVTVAADRASPAVRHHGIVPKMDTAALATGPWYVDRVDRSTPDYGPDRGKHASIATRYQETFISYYDATDTSLRAAYQYQGSGGATANCGPGNTWRCEVIDNTADVGQWSSIAAAPYGAIRFGIAYYDATNNALKFASYSCASDPCTSSPQTVAKSPLALEGMYASAKYDTNGVVHIAFQSVTLGTAMLRYAHSVSSGGNCGEGTAAGKWQCDLIDSGPGIGQYASLDLNGSNQPRIAYHDAGNKHLKYATLVGAGTGNCGPGNTWKCDVIDDVGEVGRFASLYQGHGEYPSIAYYDATNGKVKFAERAEAAGNCGPLFLTTRTWQCDAIADMGTGLTLAGVSIEDVGGAGPVIAYMDGTDPTGHSVLSVARSQRADAGAEHNCGPGGYPSRFVWWCEAIDGGDSWTNEASYVSMAADYKGWLSIAYYETDDYYGTGYLKFAHQGGQLHLPFIRK